MSATTTKVMVGVRLPREQAETIRRLAGGERTASDVIRQLVAVGLEKQKERE